MIHLNQVYKQFGKQILYRNATFSLLPKDRVGLVGSNGAGKSTLFRILAGQEGVDGGEVSILSGIQIGYFSQEVGEMSGRTVLEEVLSGAGRLSFLKEELQKLEQSMELLAIQAAETGKEADQKKFDACLDRHGALQLEFQQRGGYDLESRAESVLLGLGFHLESQGRPVDFYSGGWKMRIELAKILVLQPDVLLMDEPTNHLDVESIQWLEEWLFEYPGALMMTSHDRDFLNRLVTRCVSIENQTLAQYAGNYDFYLQEREVRRDILKATQKRQQDMIEKEETFIARFGAKASLASRVQSRVKKLEKIERIEIPPEEKKVTFRFPEAPRSGQEVLKIQDLGHAWEGQNYIFRNFRAVVRRGDRVAVVGTNGAGKSTLLKCLAHQMDPLEGEVQEGSQVHTGYFSQSALDLLDPQKTLLEDLEGRFPEASRGWVRNLLGAFLFSGDAVEKKIMSLSGGEKSRAVLASLFGQPRNLLILDEPTNHLDIQTRELLQEAIQAFPGTLLVVSHDRHFLRATTNRVFEVNQGKVRIYEGSYADFLASKQAPVQGSPRK